MDPKRMTEAEQFLGHANSRYGPLEMRGPSDAAILSSFLIEEERSRQRDVLGWTHGHDSDHDKQDWLNILAKQFYGAQVNVMEADVAGWDWRRDIDFMRRMIAIAAIAKAAIEAQLR